MAFNRPVAFDCHPTCGHRGFGPNRCIWPLPRSSTGTSSTVEHSITSPVRVQHSPQDCHRAFARIPSSRILRSRSDSSNRAPPSFHARYIDRLPVRGGLLFPWPVDRSTRTIAFFPLTGNFVCHATTSLRPDWRLENRSAIGHARSTPSIARRQARRSMRREFLGQSSVRATPFPEPLSDRLD